ncbi:hypothetical protein [Rubripirellula reticaptiva]|uniref:Uncharacterized protein n=1 Tax=Rubripirellula reticaptiva TaxID=2528013 RepID=A0A5C6FAW1_9BACT|nr:hypothetical protein [Rubripirellula reticaptiva]TWU57680.1 hypothetical protein Poly59_05870 [Rubripirellula reticaptiva]
MSEKGRSVVSFETSQIERYVDVLFMACGLHNDWQRFRREINEGDIGDGWLTVDKHLESIQQFQQSFLLVGESCVHLHSEASMTSTEGWGENLSLKYFRWVQQGLKQAGNGATAIGKRIEQVLSWSGNYNPWRELNDQNKEEKNVWVGCREGLQKCYLLQGNSISGLPFEMRIATHKQAIWPVELVSTMVGNQRIVADEMNEIGGSVSIDTIADLAGWKEPFDDSIRGLTREFNAKLIEAGIDARIGRSKGRLVKKLAAD